MKKRIISAPGRICLFGEHQDYLGLDVIAAAINLRFRIIFSKRNDSIFNILMPDINSQLIIEPSGEIKYENNRDYLKATINILKREYKFDFKEGYDFIFKSEIPINAGASSSSVMLVAWVKTLLKIFNHPDADIPEKVADIAYNSEVVEFKESGGMMDHYSSSIGGLLHIETKYKPVKYEKIDYKNLNGFVLANSLQPKDTVGVLKKIKKEVLESVELIKKYIPDFSFEKYTLDDIKKEILNLPENLQLKLKANMINHSLFKEALKLLKQKNFNEKELGKLLDEHHKWLRDGLGISTPKIEYMLMMAKKAGALGGKINGSGGGGTMFVYAPGNENKVANALKDAGGVPYIINIDKGCHEE